MIIVKPGLFEKVVVIMTAIHSPVLIDRHFNWTLRNIKTYRVLHLRKLKYGPWVGK